ncbi:hypothetical protein M8J75_000118 [Diaphorina citri]|nr:hypothetical protein M8J75_000118 [Diaphorina citri]
MSFPSLYRVCSQMRPVCQIQQKVFSISQTASLCCGNQAIQQYHNRSRSISTCSQLNQITKTTGAEYLYEKKSPWLKSLIKKLGWKFLYKGKFSMLGYQMYESIIKNVNYLQFFKDFEMEDTFHSWFLVVELHVWMMSVRVMRDEEFGKVVRDGIIQTMWSDIEERSQHLTRAQVQELSDEFRAAFLNYDEGILGDDKVLAGAVWRRFFCKNCDNPELIERLVHYIRHQISVLDHTSNKDLFVEQKPVLISLSDVPMP